MAQKYRAGGMGYGEAKKQVLEASLEYFSEARERRVKLEADPDYIQDVLKQGAQSAREKGKEVLDRARAACGLGHLSTPK